MEAWVRPLCALVVAGVAACTSHVHQRSFVLQGGADRVSASLWPLSADGLLLLATPGLPKQENGVGRRAKWAVWTAFLRGIAVSLAFDRLRGAAAGVAVGAGGRPPVALSLSVELLDHRTGGHRPDGTGRRLDRDGADPGAAGLTLTRSTHGCPDLSRRAGQTRCSAPDAAARISGPVSGRTPVRR
ncbi:DUF2637 domain-containing protein [Streptomyces fuscichromogenes]|uniref:DUF2637 domain-containing protein n=1 Tax=Streptomyces fuscichromogenes TaxID=1324013 RepID=UPI001670AD8C|nr:DUF2637 domain-containing protein [Streptomyces fuscichromogenes]